MGERKTSLARARDPGDQIDPSPQYSAGRCLTVHIDAHLPKSEPLCEREEISKSGPVFGHPSDRKKRTKNGRLQALGGCGDLGDDGR